MKYYFGCHAKSTDHWSHARSRVKLNWVVRTTKLRQNHMNHFNEAVLLIQTITVAGLHFLKKKKKIWENVENSRNKYIYFLVNVDNKTIKLCPVSSAFVQFLVFIFCRSDLVLICFPVIVKWKWLRHCCNVHCVIKSIQSGCCVLFRREIIHIGLFAVCIMIRYCTLAMKCEHACALVFFFHLI